MIDNYYQFDQPTNKPKVVKRLKWFFWGGFIAAILVIIGFFAYSFLIVKPTEELPTSSVRTTVIAPNITVFKTEYFQFQAGENWAEVASNDEGVYRYRSVRDPLTEHDLTIYVNPSQPEINRLRATRVQVVDVTEDGNFSLLGGITESCAKAGKNVQDNDVVTFHETTFKCVAGGALFDVLVSQKGGTPVFSMVRPDGTTINIAIYYRDLRATPDGRELAQIAKTFHVR